jgi:hypothetical protein
MGFRAHAALRAATLAGSAAIRSRCEVPARTLDVRTPVTHGVVARSAVSSGGRLESIDSEVDALLARGWRPWQPKGGATS